MGQQCTNQDNKGPPCLRGVVVRGASYHVALSWPVFVILNCLITKLQKKRECLRSRASSFVSFVCVTVCTSVPAQLVNLTHSEFPSRYHGGTDVRLYTDTTCLSQPMGECTKHPVESTRNRMQRMKSEIGGNNKLHDGSDARFFSLFLFCANYFNMKL